MIRNDSFIRHSLQEPCVPATSIFYRILQEKLGLDLADAAQPLANESVIREACYNAGFEHVQVNFSEL